MTTNSNSYRSLPSENIPLMPTAHPAVREGIDRWFLSENQLGAITGTTDSMIIPEEIALVEVEPQSSILKITANTPTAVSWGAGLSFLGLVACGAIFIHQFSQKKKSPDRVMENNRILPIALTFFFDRSLPTIPKETRCQHDRALTNANLLAEKVLDLDSDRFREADFISFVRLKYGIYNRVDEYRDLDRPLQRLGNALKIRKLYRAIERIESTYREPKSQEFYRFVAYLLAECPAREMFRFFLREKFEESLSSIASEIDRNPLVEYFQAIEAIVDDNLGFTLLGLFKDSRSNYLLTLTLISDLIDSLDLPEENTERTLAGFVRQQYESLFQLRSILMLNERETSLDTFVKILQYLVLAHRYRLSIEKFERAIALLGEWYLCYQIVINLRQEYPPTEYRQPKNFSEAIPGIELYQKYENSLDQRSMVS